VDLTGHNRQLAVNYHQHTPNPFVLRVGSSSEITAAIVFGSGRTFADIVRERSYLGWVVNRTWILRFPPTRSVAAATLSRDGCKLSAHGWSWANDATAAETTATATEATDRCYYTNPIVDLQYAQCADRTAYWLASWSFTK
jgi:hypothetical protein